MNNKLGEHNYIDNGVSYSPTFLDPENYVRNLKILIQNLFSSTEDMKNFQVNGRWMKSLRNYKIPIYKEKCVQCFRIQEKLAQSLFHCLN